MSNGVKVCKNKKCQKVLPADYKYSYCEACRNQHAQMAKNVLTDICKGAAAVASVTAAIITIVKRNSKS